MALEIDRVTDAGFVGASTVIAAAPTTVAVPITEAVIVATPLSTAVTNPAALITVAIEEFEDVQLKVAADTTWLFASRATAVNC